MKNPVKKNMDKFHKPKVEPSTKDYKRKKINTQLLEDLEFMTEVLEDEEYYIR